jgi:hypothetical protein
MSLQQARIWLQHCLQHHDQCRRRVQGIDLPTRLIHVSRGQEASPLSARIVYGKSLSLDTQYLSLSHCWGSAKLPMLTRENIHGFETCIPLTELIPVFEDTMFIAANLGVSHLWIDSLCIIQNDPEDWGREALRMGDVYRGAVCNISASAFKNGLTGFLSARRDSDPTPPKKRLHPVSNRPFLEHLGAAACCILEYEVWADLCYGPLFSRAWTLQEQILVSLLNRKFLYDTDLSTPISLCMVIITLYLQSQ